MLVSEVYSAIKKKLVCAENTKDCYRYRVNFVIKYGGDIELEDTPENYFSDLRKKANEFGISPHTTENSIKDFLSLLRRLKINLEYGTPLKRTHPNPDLITLEQFNKALPHMPDWLRTFCSLGYCTGLRRGDLHKLDLPKIGKELILVAAKTGKPHRFPVPKWCLRSIVVGSFPKDYGTIYRHLKRSCKSAGVDYFTPQQIRVLSARTWNKVSNGLGPLILGHSLPGWSSATPFYLDAFEPLFDNACDFPAPDSLLTTKERCAENARKERILRMINKLNARKQEALLTVAEGMVG